MKLSSIAAGIALSLASYQSVAEVVSVDITNLTHGNYFTPLLLVAHDADTHLYEVGSTASAALQAMAEGGSLDALIEQSEAVGASYQANPAGGLLAPGASTSVTSWDTETHTHLSITGMILPTNDGFVGLDSYTIPTTPGVYTLYLNGYDAGTEANDEIVNGGGASGTPGIPANPGADGGVNATGVTFSESNSTVHVHRGVLGDTDDQGGVSDLDSRIHRWINPIAKVVITVE